MCKQDSDQKSLSPETFLISLDFKVEDCMEITELHCEVRMISGQVGWAGGWPKSVGQICQIMQLKRI